MASPKTTRLNVHALEAREVPANVNITSVGGDAGGDVIRVAFEGAASGNVCSHGLSLPADVSAKRSGGGSEPAEPA